MENFFPEKKTVDDVKMMLPCGYRNIFFFDKLFSFVQFKSTGSIFFFPAFFFFFCLSFSFFVSNFEKFFSCFFFRMKWSYFVAAFLVIIALASAEGEIWEEDDHEVLIRSERGAKNRGTASGKRNLKEIGWIY